MLVALVIQVLLIFVVMLIDRGGSAVAVMSGSFLSVVVDAFLQLASTSVTLFIVAILIRVILNLLQRYFGPITEMLNEMTEPLMRPIRRIVPPLGVIDLSAYITMILLIALNMVIADLRPPY